MSGAGAVLLAALFELRLASGVLVASEDDEVLFPYLQPIAQAISNAKAIVA